MKRRFTASVVREGDWHVAQCPEVDVASQGQTELEALANLREALDPYFEQPRPTAVSRIEKFEVELRAAWAASVP